MVAQAIAESEWEEVIVGTIDGDSGVLILTEKGGTAFTVTLPLSQEAQPPVHRPAATGETNHKI